MHAAIKVNHVGNCGISVVSTTSTYSSLFTVQNLASFAHKVGVCITIWKKSTLRNIFKCIQVLNVTRLYLKGTQLSVYFEV